MTNPYIYTDVGSDEPGKEKSTEKETEIVLSENHIIMIADRRRSKITLDFDTAAKYMGKFLRKKDDVMTIGVCVDTKKELEHKKDDIVTISYIQHKSLFSFNVMILNIRKAEPKDGFDIKDMNIELGSSCKYNKYIFDILPLTGAELQQRREFFRMSLNTDIYYKIIDAEQANGTTPEEVKFDPSKAKEVKKSADGGLLEKEQGYLKLTTDDLSAGGFKYKSEEKPEDGTFMKCALIINDEALPAVAQVLSSKPDDEYPELYDVRVLYHVINDAVRDRVIRYIFARQRQMPSGNFRRKF